MPRRTPRTLEDFRIAPSVLAGELAFVRCLVQQGQVNRGVAGDEDVAVAGLHRHRVVNRHTAPIELQRRVVEVKGVDYSPAGR